MTENISTEKAKRMYADNADASEKMFRILRATKDPCACICARRVGINELTVILKSEFGYKIMFNPEIIRRYDSYLGAKTAYADDTALYAPSDLITVRYEIAGGKTKIEMFSDREATLLRREIDYCYAEEWQEGYDICK